MSIEAYIKRRGVKYAVKQAEKLDNRVVHLTAPAEPAATGATLNGLGFVIDTSGDPSLDTKGSTFAEQANAAIADGRSLVIMSVEGNEIHRWEPHMPLPMDPRLWAGINVQDLPRPVRSARDSWVAAKRRENDAIALAEARKPERETPEAQRKAEAREALVMQILVESRKAMLLNGHNKGVVHIDSIKDIPLVRVATKVGPFAE